MENFDLLWWFIVIDPPDCSSISTTWILTDLPSISMLLVAVSEHFLSVPPANKEETSTNMYVKHVIMPENPPKHCTFECNDLVAEVLNLAVRLESQQSLYQLVLVY